ncbi:hypothetical protein RSAG8_04988, partial [Rhizoctonia solani AG-8 WAC10335]
MLWVNNSLSSSSDSSSSMSRSGNAQCGKRPSKQCSHRSLGLSPGKSVRLVCLLARRRAPGLGVRTWLSSKGGSGEGCREGGLGCRGGRPAGVVIVGCW